MKKVALLLTVHNRKEKTIACLEACNQCFQTFRKEDEVEFSIYMTDDGCSDGTAEAVAAKYPEVNIVRGDGSLYWNRGMIAAWNEAAKDDFDFYIWINDDTILLKEALAVLLETSSFLDHKDIVVGTCKDTSDCYSYGGRSKSGRLVEPDAVLPKPCDIFNGNLVLVPKFVYCMLGMMDSRYSHWFGDFDYGLRAEKSDIISVVAPGTLAICDRHDSIPVWRDSSFSLKARYKALSSPKGRPLKEQFVYDMRLYNFFYAIGHFITTNLRVLFPKRKK